MDRTTNLSRDRDLSQANRFHNLVSKVCQYNQALPINKNVPVNFEILNKNVIIDTNNQYFLLNYS